MTDNRTKGVTAKLCGILIFAILLVAVPAVLFDFYYDLNDDTMIKDILSGAYTGEPSAYCIQMLYPLSWCISMFYRAIPGLPWYGLFLCLCQFGVFVLVAWRLMNVIKSKFARLSALVVELLIIFGLFFREITILQYSVTSGICMAGAVFLFITSENSDKASVFVKRNIVPVLLVIISFMIRTEVCIMLMPFLMLAGVFCWMKEKEVFNLVNIKKYSIIVLSAIIGILVAFSIDKLAYSKNGWESFMEFFDARTDIYDFYGIPSYDDNKDFYDEIGLSREAYTLLENYNFALDDSLDSWRLEAISDYQRQKAYDGEALNSTFGFVTKNSVKEAIWLYKNYIISGFKALTGEFFGNKVNSEGVLGTYAVIGAYVIYAMVCLLQMNGKEKGQAVLKILALFLIRSILWMYLYMVDRVLGRVTTPLIMMELAVLIAFILKDLPVSEDNDNSQKDKIATIFNGMTNAIAVLLAALFLVSALAVSNRVLTEEYNNRIIADERWNMLMDYCRSNDKGYYVIDVYSSTSFNGAPYSEKIFKNVDNSYKNFDICGGWAAKSPVYEQKLAKMNLKSIKSALYEKQNNDTFFVAGADKDLSWLSAFYKKYGQQAEPVCIDEIRTPDNEVIFKIFSVKKP